MTIEEETITAVQTDATNLAMAFELALGSRSVPGSGWFNLDPNGYGEIAGTYKKLARDPITKKMQLQKGMLVDEDSGIALEFDVTKDNIDRFGEAIFRSVTKHSGGTGLSLFRPTAVTGAHYVVAASGDLVQRMLVVARGFDRDANVGLKMVGAGSSTTTIPTSGLVAEGTPPDNATLEVAGFRGATGDLWLDTDGNLNSTTANFTQWGLNEFQCVYLGGEDDDNRFATELYFGAARIAIDGITATKLTFDKRSWAVEAFADLDLDTLTVNLNTVVQARVAGPDGNDITVAVVADGVAAAKAELDMNSAGNSVHIDTIIRAKLGGTAGNLITVEVITGAPTAAGVLTEIGTHVKLAIKITATATTVADLEALIATSALIEVKTTGTGATVLDASDAFDSVPLAGGTAATAASVAEVGDATTLHITSGTTTVAQLEAAITAYAAANPGTANIEVARPGTAGNVLVITDDDFAATNLAGGSDGIDLGTGKEIDVYFSRWLRNVSMDHDDYRKPSIVFELTYPELAEDGGEMYEYMLGNMCDEWKWNIPLTTKATINATFVGTRTLPLTETRKTGPEDALDPVTTNGVSTATDLQRLRLSDVDDLGISSDFTSVTVTAKNNISPEKQLAHLGAKIMNQGVHMESFEADVIFTSPEVIRAVRDNRTCTFDALMRNADFGCLLDLHAMTLDSSGRKMEKNKSIKIASKGTGFEHDQSGSTASLSLFAWLPPLPPEE